MTLDTSAAPRATISVAKDEAAIADALCVALGREGSRCLRASLAEQARQLFRDREWPGPVVRPRRASPVRRGAGIARVR